MVPAFYALGRSRVPVAISAVAVSLNVALNLILIKPMGYRGLALGTALTAILNFLLLFYWLQKYIGSLRPNLLITSFFKVMMASMIMGIGCFYFHQWFYLLSSSDTTVWKALVLFLSIGVGLIILFFACKLLRISELDSAVNLVKRRLK